MEFEGHTQVVCQQKLTVLSLFRQINSPFPQAQEIHPVEKQKKGKQMCHTSIN